MEFPLIFKNSQMAEVRDELIKVLTAERDSLAASDSLFRLVTDAIPVSIIYVDYEFRYRFVNKMACSLTGKTSDELIGKAIWEVFGIEFFKERQDGYHRVLLGEEQNLRGQWIEPCGRRRNMNNNLLPHFDGSQVIGFIGVAWDQTDEVEKALALENLRFAADQANAAKSSFLAMMSHEIRTPLGSILGYSELLRNNDLSKEEKNFSLDAIARNGKMLMQILDDFLDLSKAEAGKIEIDLSDFYLLDLIHDVLSIFRHKAKEKNLALTMDIHPAVPPAIRADAARLRQILVNLISNAIKFTNEGEIQVQVSSSMEQDVHKLSIQIKDTGVGLLPGQLEKIFEPYHQAEKTTARKYGGTGLGLSLSRELARTLKGDISVQSEPGKGSIFTFSFIAETALVLPKHEPIEKSAGDQKPLQDIRILVTDDSMDNRVLIRRVLERLGAVVELASDGAEAVSAALNGNFDLILMDIQMPELDGYEATAILRRNGFIKPVIALTAHAMPRDHVRTKEAGCDGHLTKPINTALLVKTISDCIKRSPISSSIHRPDQGKSGTVTGECIEHG